MKDTHTEELGNTKRRARPGPTEEVHYGDPRTGYEALKGGAALVDRSGRTVLRLAGKDPIGMLNAILTNEVPEDESVGAYAALLNPKGRIQTDLRILKSGEGVLVVDTEPEGAAAAKNILSRYAPFSRVKLEDLSEDWSVLGLYGPRSSKFLGNLRLAEHESIKVEIGGVEVLAAGVAVPVPGFDLIGPTDALGAAREHLAQTGARLAEPDAYETARVEAGIPRFGSDITPENFPAEAGILERAVSFSKGCYPGQETVAKMHYRGHPNKKLYRFAVEGPTPEPGEEILQREKSIAGPISSVLPVGWISSTAPLPVDNKILALGYLSRKADLDSPLRASEAALRVLGEAS